MSLLVAASCSFQKASHGSYRGTQMHDVADVLASAGTVNTEIMHQAAKRLHSYIRLHVS